MYNAHINSKNKLTGIDLSLITMDEYGSTNVQNIKVNENIYTTALNKGIEYYIYQDGEIVENPEYINIELQETKQSKIEQNDLLRDKTLNNGVEYKGVIFDSDTDQKINLLAMYSVLEDDNSVIWYGKDNQGLLCTKNDLISIGALITQLHTYCWTQNAFIKEQINNANTLEELNSIEINYEMDEE